MCCDYCLHDTGPLRLTQGYINRWWWQDQIGADLGDKLQHWPSRQRALFQFNKGAKKWEGEGKKRGVEWRREERGKLELQAPEMSDSEIWEGEWRGWWREKPKVGGARGRPYGSSTNVLNYKSWRELVGCQVGLQTGPPSWKPGDSQSKSTWTRIKMAIFTAILCIPYYCKSTFLKLLWVALIHYFLYFATTLGMWSKGFFNVVFFFFYLL